MTDLDLVYRNAARNSMPVRAMAVRVFRVARPFLKIPRGKTAELSITLVGPARMRALNRRYRRRDEPTDVLSFPLPGPRIRGYTSISLGDLFICPAIVRTKAAQWSRPVRTQMTWTLVHGLLHLAGYDHEQGVRAAARMASLERTILRKLG